MQRQDCVVECPRISGSIGRSFFWSALSINNYHRRSPSAHAGYGERWLWACILEEITVYMWYICAIFRRDLVWSYRCRFTYRICIAYTRHSVHFSSIYTFTCSNESNVIRWIVQRMSVLSHRYLNLTRFSVSSALCWISDSEKPFEVLINGLRRGVPPKHRFREKSRQASSYPICTFSTRDTRPQVSKVSLFQVYTQALAGLGLPIALWVILPCFPRC